MVPSNINLLWVRILSTAANGFAFLVLSGTGLSVVLKKRIGHRMLIWMTILFFGERSVSSFLTSFDLWWNQPSLTLHVVVWVRLFGAVLSLIFACYVLAQRDDILISLETTEMADEVRKDIVRDEEQMELNLCHIAEKTAELSRETRLKQERICQHRLQSGSRA